nr:PucR family transcriptional regulator [Nocardioides perillae]
MQEQLPAVAERVVETIIAEVPSYSEPFRGRMGRTIESAVRIALGGFLDLASSRRGFDPGTRVESVFEAAYALGQGEARSGRSMDALASAYRVGARTAWRDLAALAVAGGLPAADLARFAELVFDYIDQLSAVSVSGHADELATTGRARQRRLDRLAVTLLTDPDPVVLDRQAEEADWAPPRTLTAVVLPRAQAGGVLGVVDQRTLATQDDAVRAALGSDAAEATVLLVPDADGPGRVALRRALRGRDAVVGPSRPWREARTSCARAVQARAAGLHEDAPGEPVDTEDHLVELVLGADPEALADLRARVLAPLADLRPSTAEKLEATLRSWVLHHGRREEVAADLFVHPQTVRYRMGQLREVYGDRLEDPRTVLELTVALALPR